MMADFPENMSEVLGSWVRGLDGLPYDQETSREWAFLLPLAADTGRELERERLARILDWMWRKVLPSLQPIVDTQEIWSVELGGPFGKIWKEMCKRRDNTADTAAHASTYGGLESSYYIKKYHRATALATAYAADGAGFAEAAANRGDFADAAYDVGYVASEAANAHGAAAGVRAADIAAAVAADGPYADPDKRAHMSIPERVIHNRRILDEACAPAYAAAFPVGRAKFWEVVKPKQLLLHLSTTELTSPPNWRRW